jgi:hypothetical protein
LPAGLLATVTIPALVITGETLLNGRLAVLPGQSHDLNPDTTAPVMTEFLAS